eukprot:NODE_4893_length_618_cov_143.773286_g4211_i0.p4 GENE.NODE_4893_length_618_cov_143.773286_g4211_i0~~NODE_4893_length_618_cov_143.773286_g4211_i0.p4  ORF type:complete len:78 (-),score=24.23 NODE_4893_length_618_cov_143.773286_g4211_i0:263-496(-)
MLHVRRVFFFFFFFFLEPKKTYAATTAQREVLHRQTSLSPTLWPADPVPGDHVLRRRGLGKRVEHPKDLVIVLAWQQ